MERAVMKTAIALSLLGVILLGINISGIFLPLRNPAIYHERKNLFKDDIVLTAMQVLQALKRKSETTEAYIMKINDAVNRGIAHYWHDEGIHKYNLRIPIHENYLLHLFSYLYPRIYLKYEYCNYRKAIERGVGFCSQQAIIVSAVLKKENIASRIIGLQGHVVVLARIDEARNVWWVLDPDFGVVIKRHISEIERDPRIVAPYYIDKGYDAAIVDSLIVIFAREGNFVAAGIKEYCGWKYWVEYLSYAAIWIFPLFLLFPLVFLSVRRNAKGK